MIKDYGQEVYLTFVFKGFVFVIELEIYSMRNLKNRLQILL